MRHPERIQKIIAQAGLASRRQAEQLIIRGEVTVNGKIAELGQKATFGKDSIKVSGKLIHTTEPPVYIALYKPKGTVSTLSDPDQRPCIGDFLKKIKYKVFPVGRMEFNTEGLILLTNDGDFAERIQKEPHIRRVYAVKVRGHHEKEDLLKLRINGVKVIEKYNQKSLIEVVIQGAGGSLNLKTQFQYKGFLVEKITRTTIGTIKLGQLSPGEFRFLKKSQVDAIWNQK